MSNKPTAVRTGTTPEGVPVRRYQPVEPTDDERPPEEEVEELPTPKPKAKPVEEEPAEEEPVAKPKKDPGEPDTVDLIRALAHVESSFGKNLMRDEPAYQWLHKPKEWAKKFGLSEEIEIEQQKKSYGPLQIMGATARELGFEGEDLYELRGREGIKYGIKYFRKQKKKYGNWLDAVAAYNAGTARKREDGTYENQQYVDKVLKALKHVRSRRK